MFTISQVHTYHLQFAGALGEDDLSRFCPAGVKVDRTGAFTTLAQVHADQAALIGLLRHLHNSGCVIVQVQVERGEAERADVPARVVSPPCFDLPGRGGRQPAGLGQTATCQVEADGNWSGDQG